MEIGRTNIRLAGFFQGLKKGRAFRVLRGGYWNNNPLNCRPAYRNNNTPDNRNNNNGFRLARTPAGPNWTVGTVRQRAGESRPVPAMAATPSEDKAGGADW